MITAGLIALLVAASEINPYKRGMTEYAIWNVLWWIGSLLLVVGINR